MNKKTCNIAEKIIEEISEDPKDKSNFISKVAWALLIFAGAFGAVFAAILANPISKYIINNF